LPVKAATLRQGATWRIRAFVLCNMACVSLPEQKTLCSTKQKAEVGYNSYGAAASNYPGDNT
jgi:hypothetical protein